MALRSWRALTIALLLASACPPPRVTNALIAASHRHQGNEAGKTVQSRARNRIGPATPPAASRPVAGISGGLGRPAGTTLAPRRRPEPRITLRKSRPSPAALAPFRLRC